MPEQPAQQETFDLVVVGGGPVGHPAAIPAARLGLRTAGTVHALPSPGGSTTEAAMAVLGLLVHDSRPRRR